MSKNLPVKTSANFIQKLEKNADHLSKLLPADIDFDFMKSNFLAAVAANPDLLTKCSESSLMLACFEACELGLMVHSKLSEAWIVPYKSKATFQLGYQGMTKLAYNAGFVKRIESFPVFAHDEFDLVFGISPKLRLVRARGNRGPRIGVYCLVELMTGGVIFDFYDEAKLENIHSRSASYRYWKKTGKGGDIWGDEHNRLEMDRKAVWRNVSKWIPRSGTRYARALEISDRDYTDYYDIEQDEVAALYEEVMQRTAQEAEEETKKLNEQATGADPVSGSIPEPEFITPDVEIDNLQTDIEPDFVKGIPKPPAKKKTFTRQDLKDELSFVFGSDGPHPDEMEDIINLMLYEVEEPKGGRKAWQKWDYIRSVALMDIDEAARKRIIQIIRRATKALGLDALRVRRFFAWCVENSEPVNSTRNMDDARKAYRADESNLSV